MSSSTSVLGSRLERLLAASRPQHVSLVFLVLYLFTWGGHYTSGDGADKIAWAKAMVFERSSDIDPGPGVRHCKFGIGHSLLAIPPMIVSRAINRSLGIRCEAALYTLIFILNGALFLGLVAQYLWPLYPASTVWATVAMMGLASIWWPYTKMDFSEPLVLTFLFAAFLLMRRDKPGWAMLVAGFASTIRPDAILLAGLLGAWQWWRKRRPVHLIPMFLGLCPGMIINLVANYVRYGSVVGSGYKGEIGFDFPLLAGLYGILLSAGKSVFLFSPPLVLGFLGWRRFHATKHGQQDAVFFLGAFAVQLLFYAKYCYWSADDNWGIRFLIPGVMLMIIPLVELVHWRKAMLAFFAAGLFVQTLAVLINGLEFLLLMRTHPMTLRAYGVAGERNRMDLDHVRYHPLYNQLNGHWLIIRIRAGLPPKPRSPEDVVRLGSSLYDALPPEVWRAVQWDFVWLWLRRKPNPAQQPAQASRSVPADAPATASPAADGVP